MSEREFAVSGMHCQSCVALVSDEVGDLPGVESVEVDLAAAKATVRYDPTLVDEAAIVAAVRAAGYEAEPR